MIFHRSFVYLNTILFRQTYQKMIRKCYDLPLRDKNMQKDIFEAISLIKYVVNLSSLPITWLLSSASFNEKKKMSNCLASIT